MSVVEHDAARPGERLQRRPEHMHGSDVVDCARWAEIGPRSGQGFEELHDHARSIAIHLVGDEPGRRTAGRVGHL